MSVARTVTEVIRQHVTLEVESIDRMYLNVYQPKLQSERGVASFLGFYRGHTFASSALMDSKSQGIRRCRRALFTHWTSQDLARQAGASGIVPSISAGSVQRILREVDLQPHRTHYWKTARLDALFKQRAEKILWCLLCHTAARLVRSGFWVACVDEMPNLQAIERDPLRRAIPGAIEQQEFEYVRHGTVNVLVFLVVHSGGGKRLAQRVKTLSIDDYQTSIFKDLIEYRVIRAIEGIGEVPVTS
jgi:hypothetical protein